jgi:transcriptional antiterminator RfaH
MPWAVVMTQAQCENKVLTSLKREGMEGCAMMVRNRRRTTPLFSRYVFVNTARISWATIKSMRGVSGILRFGEVTPLIEDKVIDELRARGDDDGVIEMRETKFRVGDRLTVTGGAFADSLVTFIGMSSHERGHVLISWLGSKIKAQVKLDDLRLV